MAAQGAQEGAQEGAADLPPQAEKSAKPARYISKFRPYVKQEAEKNKSKWKTMGPAKVAVPSPNDFLQKRSKEPKLAPKKKEQDGKKGPTLSVPRRTYRPVIRIQKNFINKNALAAIRGVPKKPRHFCVDSRQGDKYLLEPSGLVPKYIKKKNYGTTPKYVTRRNEEIKKVEEEYEASVVEQFKERTMKHLSDEEKTSVLQALKKNWEETNSEFLCLPVQTDTRYKKMRKEKLELKLKQLEHDIEALEKHKGVYIANE